MTLPAGEKKILYRILPKTSLWAKCNFPYVQHDTNTPRRTAHSILQKEEGSYAVPCRRSITEDKTGENIKSFGTDSHKTSSRRCVCTERLEFWLPSSSKREKSPAI